MVDEYDEDYAFNRALEDYKEIDENTNIGNAAVRFMRDPETQILTKDNAKSLVGKMIRWTHPKHYENAPRMHEGKIIAIEKGRIIMEEKSEHDGKPFRHDWIFMGYEGYFFCYSDEERPVHFQVV